MPSIPMYCTPEDIPDLLEILTENIAFIISEGDGKWKAVKPFMPADGSRTALWHVPSGPLPLLSATDAPAKEIENPWLGWKEERPGAEPDAPYFGPGHPGIFWLNLNLSGKEPDSCCGLSSLEWIGNRYSIIGDEPSEATSKRWAQIKRQLSKVTQKVPLGGRSMDSRPEVYAFPNAFAQVRVGDINPF